MSINEAIIYEIFPRVFSKEGNFQGIINRLPELSDLGVNTLWLMPLHKIGMKNRKGTLGSPYAVCDYYSVNPDLGTEKDFRKLVTLSHKNNFRLILDWVAMYTAWDHPWIKQHPDWYRKNEEGKIIFPPDTDWYDIAHLNYGNRELHEAMINAMEHWLKKFDIDGFRCDTAGNMYGEKPTIFWKKAIKQLRKIKPEILMLAEWEDAEFHKDAFDLTYSWKLYHLLKKIRNNEEPASSVHKLLIRQKKEFPKDALRLRIIENHDEQRAANTFGKEVSKIYAALIFTIDGVPLLYNGQEIGETERPSHFETLKINWKNGDERLRDFYKKLIKIRLDNPALIYGDLKKIPTDYDDKIYAFSRTHQNNTVVSIINFSTSQLQTAIQFPQRGVFQDALTDKSIKVDKNKRFYLKIALQSAYVFIIR